MKIKFWGVRGSIPCPGPLTVRYGGNTPCIEVRLPDTGRLIIIDAGSGIRELGNYLMAHDLPHGPLPPGFSPDTPVVDLIASSSIVKSKGDARRQIQQGGISLNGSVVRDVEATSGDPLDGGYYWVRRGRKNHFIFQPPV